MPALIVIGPALAHADVAPTPWAVSAATSPTVAVTRADVFGRDLDIDVSMESERVDIDVYPTLVSVRAEFVLRAGERGAPAGLAMGFPERLPHVVSVGRSADGSRRPGAFMGTFTPLPLEGLSVRSESREVNPRFVERASTFEGMDREFSAAWWVWEERLPAGSVRKVEVRYLQALCDWEPMRGGGGFSTAVGYILTTGRLWKGLIGQADIHVTLHGDGLELGEVSREAPQPERSPGTLVWKLSSFEPDADIAFELRARSDPTTGAPARSDRSLGGAPGDVQLLDRVVRAACPGGGASEAIWSEAIEWLDEPESSTQRLATELRADLAASGACEPWLGPRSQRAPGARPTFLASAMDRWERSLAAACEERAQGAQLQRWALGAAVTGLALAAALLLLRRRRNRP